MSRTTAILIVAIASLLTGTWQLVQQASPGWVASGPAHDANKPRLVLPTDRIDLGDARGEGPFVARFPVHNGGSRRLVVRPESGACCGAASAEGPLIIPPGGAAVLEEGLTVAGRRGRVSRRAAYTTNDPISPRFTVTVEARVGETREVPTVADDPPRNLRGSPSAQPEVGGR